MKTVSQRFAFLISCEVHKAKWLNSECLNITVKSKHHLFNGLVRCICLTLACSDMDSSFLAYFVVSPKSLLSSCDLYNVHEKSPIEGECELNYQKHRGQREKKDLIFLRI